LARKPAKIINTTSGGCWCVREEDDLLFIFLFLFKLAWPGIARLRQPSQPAGQALSFFFLFSQKHVLHFSKAFFIFFPFSFHFFIAFAN
jgi:hypothetical protein